MTTSCENKLPRAALWYPERMGFSVFPLAPRSKEPGIARRFGGKGVHDATKDLDKIKWWWGINPLYNIGIACGDPSGIMVLDVDAKSDGDNTLSELTKAHGDLPDTLISRTGGGGAHYLFRHIPGTINSASKIGDGLDIRSDGGFIVAPPSIHPCGKPYAWDVDHSPPASKINAAPAWLVELLNKTATNGAARMPEEWHALIANGVAEGSRNESIAAISGHLLRRYTDPRIALDLVLCWNATRCRPPLDEAEITKTFASICRKEEARRAAEKRQGGRA